MQQILLGSGAVVSPAPDSVSYSVLSGGGSGTESGGNGSGGAGAIPVQGTFAPTGGTTYNITIGLGGTLGGDGNQSSIAGVANGSPGGGAGTSANPGGNNASFSGNSGSIFSGGGGAGAGGNATNPGQYSGGNGGPGVVMPLHPTGLRVGGGGAGASMGGQPPASASDGGGTVNNSGAANRGGGGGDHASGGSGRIILRYSDSFPEALTTGSVNTSQSGGFRTYDFISNGTITF